MKRAVIITGGEILDVNGFDKTGGSLFICADSGIKNAQKLSVSPQVVIGDFDSFKDALPENATQIIHPPIKDKTDTALAAEYAIEQGYTQIDIWGGTGGRLDHTVANIYLLYSLYKKGITATLCDGKNRAWLTDGNSEIKKGEEKYISVFPLFDEAAGVSILGAKYPLSDYTLSKGSSLGVSNEIIGEKMTLSVDKGLLLIITSSDS